MYQMKSKQTVPNQFQKHLQGSLHFLTKSDLKQIKSISKNICSFITIVFMHSDILSKGIFASKACLREKVSLEQKRLGWVWNFKKPYEVFLKWLCKKNQDNEVKTFQDLASTVFMGHHLLFVSESMMWAVARSTLFITDNFMRI